MSGFQPYPAAGSVTTLAALAARTVGANGDAAFLGYQHRRYVALLNITASATASGDTLDVYVDVSIDGTTWLNAIHFTQQAGDGAATKRFAVLDSTNPGTSDIAVATDATAGAVRPALFGPYVRARWAMVDYGSNGNTSHTFSVTLLAA